MSESPCPHCGSTARRIMYNSMHVREVYCGECFRCLNQEQVTERTRVAQMAAKEGRLNEFWMGSYKPEDDEE